MTMFCKKCKTKQKDGQKYCPKCGEPFIDENEMPYLKDIKKNMQEVLENFASEAEELTKQGKKLVIEKVQPQFNCKFEELKSVDWKRKKSESIKSLQGFFSNTDKLRTATILIAIISVLWFFIFNHGFSASWPWWLCATGGIVAAFYKVEATDKKDELKKCRCSFGFVILFALIFIFHCPSSTNSIGDMNDDISVKASNSKEEETIMKMAKIYGKIREEIPRIQALYDAHQNYIRQGGSPTFSPAWGKWQDSQDKIMKLWDEYIGLASQLDDNKEIIQEAKERKKKMSKAFDDMFIVHY